ncbi:MAG: ComF family protein [Gemmatimonadota bacterium]
MATPLRSVFSGLADLVFAPVCLGCDGAIRPGSPGGATGRLVCGRCRSRLRPIPSPICERCGGPRPRTGRAPGPTCPDCDDWPTALRGARSAHLHAPPADRLVHQLKYRGWRALAEPMAASMARAGQPADALDAARIVVPVPTTAVRLRERGYNQAALLAEAYARRTGRTMRPLLQRISGASSQTTLQAAARGANVAGAFRVVPGAAHRIAGAALLLVDDVLTTGATAGECARTLVAAGARSVFAITYARTLDVRRLDTTWS